MVDGLALVGFVGSIPVLVFLHELGHAIPVVAAGGRAEVCIGDTIGRSVHLGPLTVTVGAPYLSTFGRCRWDGVDARTVRQLSYLGGPAMTSLVVLVVFAVLSVVRAGVGRSVLQWIMLYEIVTLVVTLAPIRYPDWWGRYGESTGDGYKSLQTLRRGSN